MNNTFPLKKDMKGGIMSAIDKLFGNKEQYEELRSYLSKNNPSMLENLYSYKDNDKIESIAVFTYEQDMWLLEYCPFKWVTNQILEQYNLDNSEFSKYINWIVDELNPERETIGYKKLSLIEAVDCWNIMTDFYNKWRK